MADELLQEISDEQALAIIQRIPETFKSIGDQLIVVRNRAQKFEDYAAQLLAFLDKTKMTEELDKKCDTLLGNAANAKKEVHDMISPYTQILDEVKKLFIAARNSLDVTEKKSLMRKIWEKRNQFAKEVEEERQRLIKEAAQRKRLEEAETTVRAELVKNIGMSYLNFMSTRKTQINAYFNEITLETYEHRSQWIVEMVTSLTEAEKKTVVSVVLPVNLNFTRDIIQQFLNDETEKYDHPSALNNYKIELEALKRELLAKLPAKKIELLEEEDILKRREEQRKALAEQQRLIDNEKNKARQLEMEEEIEKLRVLAEENRIKQEQLDEQKRQREATELEEMQAALKRSEDDLLLKQQTRANTGSVAATFRENVSVQNIQKTGPATKTETKIIVVKFIGWQDLFKFYVTREALGLNAMTQEDLDGFTRKEFGTFKVYAEKAYKATGIKIESEGLVYEDVVATKITKIKSS